jgi:hypothetical protein
MMATLRDTMMANIADAEAKVVSLKDELAKMENEGQSFLIREIHDLQSWLQGLAGHVFSRGTARTPEPELDAATTGVPVAAAASDNPVTEQ